MTDGAGGGARVCGAGGAGAGAIATAGAGVGAGATAGGSSWAAKASISACDMTESSIRTSGEAWSAFGSNDCKSAAESAAFIPVVICSANGDKVIGRLPSSGRLSADAHVA